MEHRARIPRIAASPGGLDETDSRWQHAALLTIDQFRPEGSHHQPETRLQLLHDGQAIHGLFRVQDRYVRCVHDHYGAPVYRDSCVEFFVQPRPALGYFNFEFNCGGNFLCNYITDPTRVGGAFKAFVSLKAQHVSEVRVVGSLPKRVEPEIDTPVSWWLSFSIPVSALEPFVGSLGSLGGQSWRGNAYKCGNDTSHPHWAAWAPVDQLNFHLPRFFGEFVFE